MALQNLYKMAIHWLDQWLSKGYIMYRHQESHPDKQRESQNPIRGKNRHATKGMMIFQLNQKAVA